MFKQWKQSRPANTQPDSPILKTPDQRQSNTSKGQLKLKIN